MEREREGGGGGLWEGERKYTCAYMYVTLHDQERRVGGLKCCISKS